MKLNKEEIKKLLPHRDPMLLVETVELTESGEAIGTYKVRGDEHFVQGHFPGNPIVPGVILCEMMAQTACVIFKDRPACRTLLTGLNNAKFRRPVVPGETITTSCVVEKSKGPFHFCRGTAKVNGELCASTEFSFALLPQEEK